MNKRHPLDELFSQQLRDASASVPDNMWNRIAKARQQKRRRLLVVWSSVGSSALTLLAAIWMYSSGPDLGSFPLDIGALPTSGVDITPPATANIEGSGYQETLLSPLAQASASSVQTISTESRQEQVRPRRNLQGTLLPTLVATDSKGLQKADYLSARVEENNPQSAVSPNTAPETTLQSEEAPIEESQRIAGPHQRQRIAVVNTLPEKSIALAKQEEIRLFANHAPRCADFAAPFFRLDLEVLGGPAYAHQTLQAKTSESLSHMRLRERSESASLSYSGGFRLAASSNVGLGLRTGVMYSEINDRFTFDVGSRMDVSVIFGPNGEIIGRDTMYTEGFQDQRRNTLRFVEIPLLLSYERQWGKLRVGVNAGAFLNLHFSARGAIYSPATEEPIDFGQQGDRDVLPIFERQATAAWYAGMSVAYNLHSRYSLIAEPYFKTFPKALSSTAYDLQQNYWMTGMQLGMRMRL